MKPWKTAALIQSLLMYAGHKAASGSKIDRQPGASSCIRHMQRAILRNFFTVLDMTSEIRHSHNVTSAENLCDLNDDRLERPSTPYSDTLPLANHEREAMAPWCLSQTLLLFSQLSGILIVSATTTVHFYTDASCKSLYATIQTDTNVGNGQCGEFATDINSASSVFVDNGCGGIYPTLSHISSLYQNRKALY